jgi:hypothetical protein
MTRSSLRCLSISLLSISLIAACGGSGKASIGGSVAGLGPGLSLTLQDNGTDTIAVSANQSFAFPTSLASGAAFNVTVLTQPSGETCSVAGGTGVVDSIADDVTNITISCATTSSVGGVVSGLAPGTSLTLLNNGQLLPIAANGPFAFPGTLPSGSTYDVAVSVQPVGETCVVANPTGSVIAGVEASVSVSCI